MIAVFRKELADHLSSKRFFIFLILVWAVSIFAAYTAIQTIRGTVGIDIEFVFLSFFTTTGITPFPFLVFLAFFIPLISITLGFDAINSERNSGNLGRLLSQPIYRDEVISGKFLAGLAVLAIIIVSIIAIVAGLGLRITGVPPAEQEVLRLLAFTLISIIYGAFWMALAVLFSILFKSSTTSMLASIGLWIFFVLFMPMIAGAVTEDVEIQLLIARISPYTLYGEVISILLMPSLDPATAAQLYTATGRLPTPLSFTQSFLLVWPQLVSIIALASICFAVSYIRFMREEIRTT